MLFKQATAILVCCASVLQISAQKDCSNDHLGRTPLIDLTDGYFNGIRGGLYPEGSNIRPAEHLTECIEHVQAITPMDIYGNPNPNGKVVMLGIGASNPMTEFQQFIDFSNDYEPVNDNLKIINACVGGQGIQKMFDITDNYWSGVVNGLEDQGLSAEQVQVVWIEQDNTRAYDTIFPSAPNALVNDYQLLLHVIQELFPNVQICYITARAYSGYADPVDPEVSGGLLYPRDYFNGWAIKFLIEKVINHAFGFESEGPSAQIPLVTWGTYHWTDGSTPREDGLYLDCDLDVGPDGLHLSGVGEYKMGSLLFDYFKTDTTAKYWYLDEDFTGITTPETDVELRVWPNPVKNGTIHVDIPSTLIGADTQWMIYDMAGRAVLAGKEISGTELNIDVTTLADGMYTFNCRDAQRQYHARMVIAH